MPVQKQWPIDYITKGNMYFSAEVQDVLLSQVPELVSDGQIIFVSGILHGDSERFAAKMSQDREDISDPAKTKILEANPVRFYRLPGS